MPTGVSLLDHGFVVLDAVCADDLTVVNAARVSFGRRKDELDDADRGLIRFLMRERHTSPFEHCFFRFHVRCPIFVGREWFRHRTWAFNEISGRYTVLPDLQYVPAQEDVRTQVGKPGAYTFEPVPEHLAEPVRHRIADAYRYAADAYKAMLDAGVAKEVARLVMPVGQYTEFYGSVNARNLMHFLSLRNHASAQHEIRVYAAAIEDMFAEAMPETHAAFIEFGRGGV